MDWAEIWKHTPALVSVVKDLVLAGVAISGAIVGWKALSKWREETVGKRRLELAEDTLSSFYQIQEFINNARAPIIWAEEMVPEEGVPENVTRHYAYGPMRRLRRSMDAILELRTKRHRFAAVFGADKTGSWAEIESVLNDMDAASFILLSARQHQGVETSELAEIYTKQRRILARVIEGDETATKVSAAVNDIEAVCRPIIEASVDLRSRA